MYKRLGLVDLISAIQLKVEDKTGLKCYDAVPSNAPSPFYFAEVVQKKADNTKTMLRDVFTVFIPVSYTHLDVYKRQPQRRTV